MIGHIRRELTAAERTAIRKLVKGSCANYDPEYGCLPLDCDCVMLQKCWTGGGCRYFRNAVLPTDPVLEGKLSIGASVETRLCAICGEPFHEDGKQIFCSDVCAGEAHRRRNRQNMRKRRGG